MPSMNEPGPHETLADAVDMLPLSPLEKHCILDRVSLGLGKVTRERRSQIVVCRPEMETAL